ncbi:MULTISPECIES: FtsB family cell division protein [Leptospirillum]|jgi:hypothetical protein|uniref:Septum formation initiator n=2 Tax=Leptospirillum ferriphilum TaxID=178606 RepID=A0A059XTI6_9BACT|nr:MULTISPECIES: hypothetical protein [Leptospirillum]EAY56501.1 MAG: hypothetical protein UBAL2_80620148a [Leptospirillum rubarum]EIJ75696.1 MAG: Hypothetical protein C75L2_00300055 [Leptospirillum sp. Group II 'C75']AIA31934.1 hypothetical protein Y981_10540 [Leptospirillum ferriphilum YSK]AKS24174.1 hypothetical protein ABH19_11130 [Leptospirillum sp. Group II 'CF-1']OOH73986.1 hypothetical protein BOX24_03060 [Leptospirillum ferriphilum]
MAHSPLPPSSPASDAAGSRFLIVVLLVSGAAMVLYGTGALLSADTGIAPLIRYRWEARDLARHKEALIKRIQDMRAHVDALRSDPFEMERIARENEHRVLEGEILVLPRTPSP